jgi:hypothetical protein
MDEAYDKNLDMGYFVRCGLQEAGARRCVGLVTTG